MEIRCVVSKSHRAWGDEILVISRQGALMSATRFHDNSFPKNQPPQSDSSDKPDCELREEYFVDAEVAAKFLSIKRKYLLKLSRLSLVPAHPLGIGSRRQWRYRISELRDWMLSTGAHSSLGQTPDRPDNPIGSPRVRKRKNQ